MTSSNRFLYLYAAVAILGASGFARAETSPCVVELFTSQGCSSCPPADKILGEIARDPNVIAMSFPVDYWDYIGWKDTLATPAFTARQKAYAAMRGDGHVYTPQAIIDGAAHVVGSEKAKIEAAARDNFGKNNALKTQVNLSEVGGKWRIQISQNADKTPAEIWFYSIKREAEVQIGRGENKGNTVTYTNVVRSMARLGEWNGTPATFEAPRSAGEGAVVLLQQGTQAKPGLILGAAKSAGL